MIYFIVYLIGLFAMTIVASRTPKKFDFSKAVMIGLLLWPLSLLLFLYGKIRNA